MRKQSSSRARRAPAWVVLAALFAGCMFGPYDREASGDRNTERNFHGYYSLASTQIEVRGWNPTASPPQYQNITTALSDSTSFGFQGFSAFAWSSSAAIPAAMWVPGAVGYSARVRARQTSSSSVWDLMSVRSDYAVCMQSSTTVEDFSAHCSAPQSPLASVRTADFQFGAAPGSTRRLSVTGDPNPGGNEALETSVAVTVPSSTDPTGTIVVAYNDSAFTAGSARRVSWAVSSNHGSSWESHSVLDPGYGFGPPAEAPGASASYGTDPTAVATLTPGQVARFGVADVLTGADHVYVAVSNDGGRHFGATTVPAAPVHLVSNQDSGPGPVMREQGGGLHPFSGRVDRPMTAVDPVDGSIWVNWVQFLTTTDGSNLSTRVQWLRGLRYDAVGALQWLTAPIEIIAPNCTSDTSLQYAPHLSIAIDRSHGGRIVHFGYANRSQMQGTGCGQTGPVAWYHASAYVSDGASGAQWVCESVPLSEDPASPYCLAPGTAGLGFGINTTNREEPVLAVNPYNGDLLMALVRGRIGQNPPPGGRSDSRVTLFHKAGGDGSWYAPVQFEPPSGFHDQWLPELSIVLPEGTNHPTIALAWHDTRDDTTSVYGGNGYSDVWTSVSHDGGFTWPDVGRMTPLSSAAGFSVPWAPQDGGDFDALAGNPIFGDFMVAWTGTPEGHMHTYAAVLNP